MARSVIRESQVLDSDFLSEEEHSLYNHRFIDLVDITTYSGHTDEFVVVNTSASGLSYTTMSGITDILDDRYYTESEVDTISGSLQSEIDDKPDTFLELTDTPSTYDNSKYLQSTAAGTFWAYIAGMPGPKGEDGGEWFSGYGPPPAVTGTLNNFYLDYNTGDIYRKESTVTGTSQYGVMLAREASGSYTFADAVRFVKTGREIIVDNIDDEADFTGSWYTYNTGSAWDNSCKYTTTDYTAQVNFRFIVPEDGEYDVYAYWPSLSAACPDAPYLITHASGTNTVRKDQRTNGSTWNYLSTHRFDGAATWQWRMNIHGTDGSTTFSGLSDTPNYYDDDKYLKSTISGIEWYDLNDDYYTESEVDTISGSLQSEIDDKPDTLLELSDTPSAYDNTKWLRSTSIGAEWATISGGILVHSDLNNLDYNSSGHTGFVSIVTNQTISGTKTFISHVYIKDMEFGTLDAYSRSQIWNYETDSIIRVGSLGSDGDPSDRVSEGIVVYGENVQGDSMGGSDWGFARIKPDRFGLQNSKNGVGQFYYFRVDGSSNEFYLRDDLGNKTFEFDRLTGNLEVVGDVYTDSSYYGNGVTLSGIPRTFLELDDTPSVYDNSKYLQSTSSGTFWAYIAGIPGPKGENGGEWISGYGVPTTTTGTSNSFYLDLNNGDVYRKVSTTISGVQYGVMVERESDYNYTFADAIRLVKTGHELIVDNEDDDSYSTGTWYTFSNGNAWDGTCKYATSSIGAETCFDINIPEDGEYDIYAWWPVYGGSAQNVPFTITHVSGTNIVRKDQHTGIPQWNYLATHEFDGAATWQWQMNIHGTNGSTTFSGLSDTPSGYDNGKYLKSTISGTEWYDLNDDYYTESEVDTISGSLQSEIDDKPDTLLELSDTPSTYDSSKYLQSTAAGTFWAYIAGIPGPKGEDGGEWLSGSGAPTTVTGVLNNFYLDYNTGDIYRKESTVTGTSQYGVMLAREADGYYTFADAVKFVRTGHETIVDNLDDGASFIGSWNIYNTTNAWDGSCRYATSDYTAQANFRFIVPEDGEYDVYAYWPVIGVAATNAPFMITHASGTTTIRKNQCVGTPQWNYLSTHIFNGAATWVWKMNIQGSTTFSGLSDTPLGYDNEKYLKSTTVGTEWYDLNDDHYTELEVDTISGSLHSDIYSHVSSTSNPHTVTLEQARIAGNTISSSNSINFRDGNSVIYSSTANELTLNATNEVVVERDLYVDRDLYVGNKLTVNGGAVVNIIRDEDDMGHDDSTALVTQQSVKAYVDAHTMDTSIHFDQFTELSDTPNSYDDEKHLVSTTSGLDWTSSVTVVAGDVCFVDTTRSNKKLGVSMIDIGCGRNSAATTNQYLCTYDGTPMNQSGIPLLFDATLVGITMTGNLNTQSWYARVRKNSSATNIYSHQLVNAYEVHSFTVNVDFSGGDRIQIYLEGNSIDYPQVHTYWRRRF